VVYGGAIERRIGPVDGPQPAYGVMIRKM
jgi:hypothetical protein